MKKSLKIPKGQSESLNQRTDNAMAKRKRTKEVEQRSTKQKNRQYNGQKIPKKNRQHNGQKIPKG